MAERNGREADPGAQEVAPGAGRRARAARRRQWSYGAYRPGPDPLAPPFDLDAAIDRIGRDVMEGSSPRQAMRELLRQGMSGRPGLDELTRRLRERRRELQRDNRIDGTLQQVRELLDRALEAERQTLAPQDTDDARFREMELDTLPDNTGRAVRALQPYEWQSPAARAAYREIGDLLGRELLDQRFAGLKDALQQATPQDAEDARRMLGDLNKLLQSHAAAPDSPAGQAQFDRFMAEHGRFFPEQPATVDELVDLLAARSAAAQRMMQALSPQQRAELAELSQQAFGDPRLAQALAELDDRLQGLRPGEDWSGPGRGRQPRFRGDNPLGLGEATRAMEELGRIDELTDRLDQSYPGAELADVDPDELAAALGDQARVDLQALRDLERELQQQGVFERAPDGSLQLSPRALRRLGESALSEVVNRIAGRRGERSTRRSGAAGEPTGASRPWAFGDTEAWNVPRTLLNAQVRRAGGDPRTLDVTDVEVVDTERRRQAAVALCVDTSWSMVQDGRWVPMKRTALALHHLISTRFRTDALQLVTFGRAAAKVGLGELVELEGAWVQGTNLHQALLLAGEHLRRHPGAIPVVLVVTDGEPTAHTEPDGHPVFSYPPTELTLGLTVSELDRLTARRAAITFFVLGEDPGLARLVDSLARRCGGRVVAPDVDGLGAEVVADYLRVRR